MLPLRSQKYTGRVRIHKHDSLGARTISYDGDVVTQDEEHLVARAIWRFPTQTLAYATLTDGDIFEEIFYFDRWYNVFEIRAADRSLKGWYANITRPALLNAAGLIWEDLYLDLWMSPNGHMQVLDQDEFDAATHLSPLDRASALGALREAEHELQRRWRAYAVASIAQALDARGWRLAIAESCTGGALADAVTEHSGISRVYLGGVLAYDNSVKTGLLDVNVETLAHFGAVSTQTAIEMARGARAATGAEIAISTTGIAGPNGGSVEKPVGLVYIGLSSPLGDYADRSIWPFDRTGNKQASVDQALRLMLQHLSSLQAGQKTVL